jgi:hypothetical protein
MLGRLGVFGAVFAGFMADGALTADAKSKTKEDDDGPDKIEGGSGEDDDRLAYGCGDDALLIGAGDYAHGGEVANRFAIGDWVNDGDIAHISDYNPDEDDIVVLYDATAHPDRHIELISEDGSGDATLFLDGIPLAIITNGAGLSVDALKLVPSNSF